MTASSQAADKTETGTISDWFPRYLGKRLSDVMFLDVIVFSDSAPRCSSSSPGPLLPTDLVTFTCPVTLSPNCSVNNPPSLTLTQGTGGILSSGSSTSVSWTGSGGTVNSSNINCGVSSSSVRSTCPTVSRKFHRKAEKMGHYHFEREISNNPS